jgi:hypothetical protein
VPPEPAAPGSITGTAAAGQAGTAAAGQAGTAAAGQAGTAAAGQAGTAAAGQAGPAAAGQQDTARGQVTVVPGIARYHRSGCTLIRFLGVDDLESMTREAAEADGCVPCRACQPDRSSADEPSR